MSAADYAAWLRGMEYVALLMQFAESELGAPPTREAMVARMVHKEYVRRATSAVLRCGATFNADEVRACAK